MVAVATLPATRSQAIAIITKNLNREVAPFHKLGDFAPLSVVLALIELEEAFGIPLEVDEVLPKATIHQLLDLVEQRTANGPRIQPANGNQAVTLHAIAAYKAASGHNVPRALRARLQAEGHEWPAVPTRPPMFVHWQDAQAERARRARVERRQLILRGVAWCLASAAFAAVMFHLTELAR